MKELIYDAATGEQTVRELSQEEQDLIINAGTTAADLEELRSHLSMTPRQLFIGLEEAGLITEDEAIQAATVGAVPEKIETMLQSLDPREQTRARITWARMSVVKRLDPLAMMLASHEGMTEESLDAFFKTYSQV